ncbi:MAG: S8 family serine peptidase, partial [Nocardioidaceae bacterium]
MSPRPHRDRWLAAACAGVVLAGLAPGVATADQRGPAGPDPTHDASPGVYVVTLRDLPTGSYDGRVRGFPATRPVAGQRFDRTRPAVAAYRGWLLARQDGLLHEIGDPAVLYRYTTALDGFAARLGTDQVKALRSSAQVALVERSVTRPVDGIGGARASAAAGVVRTRSGGPDRAGHGTVIGVVDTGIWPESPSFAGLPQTHPGRSPHLRGFHGACAAAQEWTARACDDKVVSARWFVRGFGAGAVARSEYLSPRDATGHGSHVASTAAGDPDVRVRIDRQGFGSLTGTAPAARIAVYKACWSAPDPADDGCTTADTVAAVDQAVADGVDVLSSAIAGSADARDSVQRAYLGATTAGVVVAASAGNDGAGSAHNAGPWVATVGASSRPGHDGEVRLGDGQVLRGTMVSDVPVRRARLVDGADVVVPGVPRSRARLCAPGSLSAAEVEGAVVVCERGIIARVDKSVAVLRAGGVGMVLVNTRPGPTDADVHAVPTVHIDRAAGRRVRAYLHATGDHATAALRPSTGTPAGGPRLAPFSAGGPVDDLLKPDLTAPGVAVLGAVAPPSDSGRMFDLLSGTSAATPRVAGLAAYLRSVHPTWSPARVRSALMTTAHDLTGSPAPLAAGAGELSPRAALDPGLVLDVSIADWRRWLAGDLRTPALNLPSVSVPDLVGATTVRRRVTNVGHRSETYVATVRAPRGVAVTASPQVLTVRPGRSRTIVLRMSVSPGARLGVWGTGRLTLGSGRHTVRLPLAVRPREVAAPTGVGTVAHRGEVIVHARSGWLRPVRLRATPLVAATPTTLTLRPGEFDTAHPRSDADTDAEPVLVPRGTELARFRLVAHDPGDDVDLYLYR